MTLATNRPLDTRSLPQAPAPAAALATTIARDEVRGWAILATGSLAIAGVFAVLVAASRVPGSDKVIPWPVAFFGKGLVVHVTFSFVVWFLTVFALLTAVVTHRLAEEGYGATRLLVLGRLGMSMVGLSFPMLLLPAFLNGSEASLNNYVPLIVHPVSEAGLALLFIGVLLPAIRLLANRPWDAGTREPLALPVTAAALIYAAAFAAFAIALAQTSGKAGQGKVYEEIFWGGGHILQFLNSTLMLVAWSVLARRTVPGAASTWVLVLAAAMLLLGAGVGLSFFTFPQIISSMPGGQIFGVMFFGSLLIAGFTSFVSILEVIVAAVREKFAISRPVAVAVVSAIGFVASVVLFTTTNGLNALDIVDAFANNIGILAAAVFECVVVVLVVRNLKDLQHHLNQTSTLHLGGWWRWLLALNAVVLTYIFVVTALRYAVEGYDPYPAIKAPIAV